MSKVSTVNYPDKKIKWALVPVLAFFYRHIGERGLLLDLIRTAQYYADMLACILTIVLFWEIMMRVIHYADRRYPWEVDIVRRVLIQWAMVFGILTPLQTAIILLYNQVLIDRPATFDLSTVFYTDVPLMWLLFSVVQMVYAVMYFYRKHQTGLAALEAERSRIQSDYQALQLAYEALKARWEVLQEQTVPAKTEINQAEMAVPPAGKEKTLLVQQGNAWVPLPLEEVAYIFKINDFTLIRTFDKRDYNLDASLEKLEDLLPATDFFRLNRQMIVARKSIRQIKPEAYGKLQIELTPTYEDEAGVSRIKAQEFRQWLSL